MHLTKETLSPNIDEKNSPSGIERIKRMIEGISESAKAEDVYCARLSSKRIIAMLNDPDVSPSVVTMLMRFSHVLYVVTMPICSVVRIRVNIGRDITAMPCEQTLANTNTKEALSSLDLNKAEKLNFTTRNLNLFKGNIQFFCNKLKKVNWGKNG